MISDKFEMLLFLSENQGETTTASLAQLTSFSQQTISRKLSELEEQGFITKQTSPQGTSFKLTQKARSYLTQKANQVISQTKKASSLNATITSGLGQGKYYMSQEGYKKQFKELLGYEPFEGTLNTKVSEEQAQALLSQISCTTLQGFVTKERNFGGLDLYPITINKKIKGAIITPHRTAHNKTTMEIIAKQNLRKIFNLKDNDTIEVSV